VSDGRYSLTNGFVSEARLTRADIAEMPDACALPRRSGEMVFHHEWERRAFAIAVSLAEQGQLEWRDFQQELIRSIAAAERNNPSEPTRGYYESWLLALATVLQRSGVLVDERL